MSALVTTTVRAPKLTTLRKPRPPRQSTEQDSLGSVDNAAQLEKQVVNGGRTLQAVTGGVGRPIIKTSATPDQPGSTSTSTSSTPNGPSDVQGRIPPEFLAPAQPSAGQSLRISQSSGQDPVQSYSTFANWNKRKIQGGSSPEENISNGNCLPVGQSASLTPDTHNNNNNNYIQMDWSQQNRNASPWTESWREPGNRSSPSEAGPREESSVGAGNEKTQTSQEELAAQYAKAKLTVRRYRQNVELPSKRKETDEGSLTRDQPGVSTGGQVTPESGKEDAPSFRQATQSSLQQKGTEDGSSRSGSICKEQVGLEGLGGSGKPLPPTAALRSFPKPKTGVADGSKDEDLASGAGSQQGSRRRAGTRWDVPLAAGRLSTWNQDSRGGERGAGTQGAAPAASTLLLPNLNRMRCTQDAASLPEVCPKDVSLPRVSSGGAVAGQPAPKPSLHNPSNSSDKDYYSAVITFKDDETLVITSTSHRQVLMAANLVASEMLGSVVEIDCGSRKVAQGGRDASTSSSPKEQLGKAEVNNNSNQSENSSTVSADSASPPEVAQCQTERPFSYDLPTLLQLSTSPAARHQPQDWRILRDLFPEIFPEKIYSFFAPEDFKPARYFV